MTTTEPATGKLHSSPASAPAKAFGAAERLSGPASLETLKRRVVLQMWVIIALTGLLMIAMPFSGEVPRYFAMMPDKRVAPLVPLTMPNMTNRAILAWATTSVTEVMTMGFGDIDIRLPQQRGRFTAKGWEAYMKSFNDLKIRETFKQSQLVLTAVPSDTPIILSKGVNVEGAFQWIVQMPIIISYATNNNVVHREKSTVVLTIVRVPSEENYRGIAIRNWMLG